VTSLIESVKKIFNPTTPTYTTTTLIVIIVAIVVKLVLGQYVKKQGEKLKSDALIASGSDALFDAVITLATLVSAGVMLLWHVSLDGILGALISLVIIKAGIEMLASPVNELLGAKISPELLSQIKREVADFDGVHGVFDIIVHNYGPDVQIGSLHVNVLDTMDAHQIHGLTRRISEEMFARHGIVMTVGVYAVATGDNKRAQLQHTVMQALAAHEHIEQVHGFYYFEDERRVSVDIVPDLTIHDDAAFIQELIAEVQPLIPDDHLTIVIDHNYSE
jgi:cation diffusion facilitator family transporter